MKKPNEYEKRMDTILSESVKKTNLKEADYNKAIKDTSDYDKWKNTRIQAKNIFRMLYKKSKNLDDMKNGLKDIIKQNKTKPDQEKVLWDEFNKYFKLKGESVSEAELSSKSNPKLYTKVVNKLKKQAYNRDAGYHLTLLKSMNPKKLSQSDLDTLGDFDDMYESVNEEADDTLMLKIGGEQGKYWPWYFKKIDSTHFKMANNEKALNSGAAMVSHVGQHRGDAYYSTLVDWLHNKIKTKQIFGKKFEGNG